MTSEEIRVAPPLSIGEPGRAASELTAGRPPALLTNADHELSECAIDGVEVRAASIRGLMHRYREEPRQDRFAISYEADHRTLLIAVCDGVGSLGQSHVAAEFASRALLEAYAATRDWSASVMEVNSALAALAEKTACEAGIESDAKQFGMKTTLVGAAVDLAASPPTASLVWTDDSVVWGLSSGTWTMLSTSDDPTEPVLHTGSVRGLPHLEPRFQQAVVALESTSGIFVMSDGVGVPLAQSSEVQATLAQWWNEPPRVFAFGEQVGFARKSHMDDRTVVGVWFPRDERDAHMVWPTEAAEV